MTVLDERRRCDRRQDSQTVKLSKREPALDTGRQMSQNEETSHD